MVGFFVGGVFSGFCLVGFFFGGVFLVLFCFVCFLE